MKIKLKYDNLKKKLIFKFSYCDHLEFLKIKPKLLNTRLFLDSRSINNLFL